MFVVEALPSIRQQQQQGGPASWAAPASPPAAAQPPAAVARALHLAAALEAAAAAQGCFPPPAAPGGRSAGEGGGAAYADVAYADVPQRARQLMTAGKHPEARALLLASVMSLSPPLTPLPPGGGPVATVHDSSSNGSSSSSSWDPSVLGSTCTGGWGGVDLVALGALWAQLAAMERQRARLKQPGGRYATARAFFRAAAACFQAAEPAPLGGSGSGSGSGSGGISGGAAGGPTASSLRDGSMQAPLTTAEASSAGALERPEHPAVQQQQQQHREGERCEGLARVLSSWGLMELQQGLARPGRRLLPQAGLGFRVEVFKVWGLGFSTGQADCRHASPLLRRARPAAWSCLAACHCPAVWRGVAWKQVDAAC